MELNEKLKEFGLSDDDLQLIESTMQTRIDEAVELRAHELLESERQDFTAKSNEIVEAFTDQFSQYSKVLAESIENKYRDQMLAEAQEIKDQQRMIVEGFITEMDSYALYLKESIENKYRSEFEQTAADIVESFTNSLDGYTAHLTEQIKGKGSRSQSALKVEMAEALIESIRHTYSKYNVQMPEMVNLEEEYNNFVQETEHSIAKLSEENKALKRKLTEREKQDVISALSEDMSYIQQEAFAELAESVMYVSKDLYTNRLTTLKEKFLSGESRSAKPAPRKQINESTQPKLEQQEPKQSSAIDVSKYINISTRKR